MSLVFTTWTHWTDAFFTGGLHKIEETAGLLRPIVRHRRGDGLGEVLAGAKQRLEQLLDRRAVFCGEAIPPQADHIQAGDAVDALGGAIVRDVLAEAAIPLNNTKIADAEELVKHSSAADEGVVADVDVTRQQRCVGEDVLVPEDHIVGQVAACHQEIAISDAGGTSRLASTVDRHVLADGVLRPKNYLAVSLRVKTKVLGLATDDRGAADDGASAHGHLPDELGMGHHLHACRQSRWAIDHDIGADFGAGIDLGS